VEPAAGGFSCPKDPTGQSRQKARIVNKKDNPSECVFPLSTRTEDRKSVLLVLRLIDKTYEDGSMAFAMDRSIS